MRDHVGDKPFELLGVNDPAGEEGGDALERPGRRELVHVLGAVGLPEFDNATPDKRPEKGLLGIRKALGVFANLRPVRTWPALVESSPLKNHLVEGTDMIIVRELTGGIVPPGHRRIDRS